MRPFSNLIPAIALSAFVSFLSLVIGDVSQVQGAPTARNAASVGLFLVANQDRLFVVRAQGAAAAYGLRAGDEIVAVNGRRVSTEAALMNRLMAGGANIVVVRNGRTIHLGAQASATSGQVASARPASGAGGGWLNPDNMVITADGRIIHKDVAARLGIEGKPLTGAAHDDNQ